MFSTLRIFPLLAIPLVLYVLGSFAPPAALGDVILTLHIPSGADWGITNGDLFEIFCLVMLFLETVKSTNTDAREIINHGLSMLVAVIGTILFVTSIDFSTTPFFMLVLMAYFDVVGGFVITIVSARRDLSSSRSG